MKFLKYINTAILILALVFTSCEKEEYNFGTIKAPSNLEITSTVVGATEADPAGDGTGLVKLEMKADNTLVYKVVSKHISGGSAIVPLGKIDIYFTELGTNTHTFEVLAIGTGGVTTKKTVTAEVFYSYQPPAELVKAITGDISKVWRIDAESKGHFGVGPPDEDKPIWWSAAPNDKEGVGAYDDMFTFNVDGTFTHTTNNTTFGKKDPLDKDIGVTGLNANGDDEYENYPLDNYTENWIITAPSNALTLSFSDKGYLGFYVGSHSYKILSYSDSELSLKSVGSFDGNAWYIKLVPVN